MNGSLITAGKYYIPISEVGQVTIDCSTIPIVEMDDGSSIFLDFSKHDTGHLEEHDSVQLEKLSLR